MTCQGPVDRRASTKTIAAIGRQRRRLPIRVVTTSGTLLDAPIELAHSAGQSSSRASCLSEREKPTRPRRDCRLDAPPA